MLAAIRRWVGSTIAREIPKKWHAGDGIRAWSSAAWGTLWVKCWTRMCQKQFKSSCSHHEPEWISALTLPSPAPCDTDLNENYTQDCCCWDNTTAHTVEVPRAVPGASLSSSAAVQKGRERCGLTLKGRLSSFSKLNSISCNTSFVSLTFNVIKYGASISEDISFHFYL